MPGAPIPAQPGGGSHTGRTIAIVTAAVAFLVLLAIIAFVAVRTLGSDDAGPSAEPATSDTPTATDSTTPGTAPSGGVVPSAPLGSITPTAFQCDGVTPQIGGSSTAGRIRGGGLSAPALADHGYSVDRADAGAITFASGVSMVSKVVSQGWISMMALGSLPKANGFHSPEQAARVVVACMAADPNMYRGAYAVPEVSAQNTKVDGHAAFSLVQQIKVNDPTTTALGDTVQVVVVDTGNAKSYGVFLMGVPIGNKSLEALEKLTAANVRVG
ncbi:hypothetical protein GCM10028772_22900 [Nocardioides ultimimeridianus]